MGVILLIARIMFAAVFFGSGLGHLTQTKDFAAYAEARGVPRATVVVQVSGVWILLGGVGLMLGLWVDLAALMVAAFALAAALFVHHPWTDVGDTQQLEFTNFMKNLALAGAGIGLWILFAHMGDIPLAITGSLFEISL